MPVTNAGVEEAKDREFTKALSAALRSDPDSLMIGEIRTLSAADLAFRGALSGHNVWSTLHANTASAVLLRLKDIGVEDFKLQDPSMSARNLIKQSNVTLLAIGVALVVVAVIINSIASGKKAGSSRSPLAIHPRDRPQGRSLLRHDKKHRHRGSPK